jgi:hypothetical protein
MKLIITLKPMAQEYGIFWCFKRRYGPMQLSLAISNNYSFVMKQFCIQCGWNENTIIQILQVFCITNVEMKHELHEVRRAQTYTRFGNDIFGIQ